nr:della protein gaip [Quercus suber]
MSHESHNIQPLPDSSVTSSSSTGKAKMCWEEEVQQNGGMDELLALLGYHVRASDMAKVAQKLELLEDLMGNAQSDGLSHLATETDHYNPFNLNARESVVTEIDKSWGVLVGIKLNIEGITNDVG